MNLAEYQYVVGYGIGQYYDYIKTRLPKELHLDYLCDAKWKQIGEKYDGIGVISPEQLRNMNSVLVVVFSGNVRNWKSITAMLQDMRLPYLHVNEMLSVQNTITGKELKKKGETVYTDAWGNRVEFSSDVEDAVAISFLGGNNLVQLGRGVSVRKLNIQCGKNSMCSIGDGTEIEEAEIIITDGKIEIGQDCLLSTSVILRNHDKHHIFDKATGKRINYAGNMKIGNHVWICHGAVLLGSAAIGDNSIVGTMAVTSSSFPKEVIIAGNPAKVIREQVCWSKDNTNFYNRDFLGECMALEAGKYF